MRRRIYSSLILMCLLSVVIATAGITVVYYRLFQNRVKEDLKLNLQILKGTGFFDDPVASIPDVNIQTDNDDLRITWIRPDGYVLYDNDNDVSDLDNHIDRIEIKQAFDTGIGESIRDSATMQMNTHYYAELLSNGTVLRVGTDASSMFHVFTTTGPIVIAISLMILLIGMIIARYLTSQLISPIEEMADHIDDPEAVPQYPELKPFSEKIQKQYHEIIDTAQMREEFSANVSHELKTPLTAINGYAELMETDEKASQQHRHFAREILKNSNRLLKLIDDTILLSKLDYRESDPLQPLRLDHIVDDVVESLRFNAEQSGIEIKTDITPAVVNGIEELLSQMTENLIQNAITYNRANGTVTVSVSAENGRGCLTVEDTGVGIPEKDRQRVFERFYRVDKSRSRAKGGTGLGLAIVKHAAEIHHAEISLESSENKGSTFRIIFPETEQSIISEDEVL